VDLGMVSGSRLKFVSITYALSYGLATLLSCCDVS
jgi:hypothetical protein